MLVGLSVCLPTKLIERLQKLLRCTKNIRGITGHQRVSKDIKKYQGQSGSIMGIKGIKDIKSKKCVKDVDIRVS